jgi:hypothetical protein
MNASGGPRCRSRRACARSRGRRNSLRRASRDGCHGGRTAAERDRRRKPNVAAERRGRPRAFSRPAASPRFEEPTAQVQGSQHARLGDYSKLRTHGGRLTRRFVTFSPNDSINRGETIPYSGVYRQIPARPADWRWISTRIRPGWRKARVVSGNAAEALARRRTKYRITRIVLEAPCWVICGKRCGSYGRRQGSR